MTDQDFIDKLFLKLKAKEAENAKLHAALFQINDIIDHQHNPYVHELTCGIDSGHAKLLPRWDESRKAVVLRCPTCQTEQTYIPALCPDATPFAILPVVSDDSDIGDDDGAGC
jgi:hypothetical protein